MDELRARFGRVLCVERDAIRSSEKRTFNRLLYKNRSQHRHGFYFKRLEHVRRLMRKVDESAVWNSLRSALGDSHVKRKGRKKPPPLCISTVTSDDLEQAALHLNCLVSIIPTTSRRVTTELVSRQHFLPFAVSVLAALARLFATEQKLLSELRGAAVETKLLLGIRRDESSSMQQHTSAENFDEDLGNAIELAQGGGDTMLQSLPNPHLNDSQEGLEVKDNVVSAVDTIRISGYRSQRPGKPARSARQRQEEQKPSLYGILVQHEGQSDPDTRPLSGNNARTNSSVCLPEKRSHDSSAAGETQPTKKRRFSHTKGPEEIRKSGKGAWNRDMSKATQAVPHVVTDGKAESPAVGHDSHSSCESEDLDDIFDALEE